MRDVNKIPEEAAPTAPPPRQKHPAVPRLREAPAAAAATSSAPREEYKHLITRLNRIEGQIRGIRSMVEKDVYCTDILVQAAAARSALNGFTRELIDQHLSTCVAEDLKTAVRRSCRSFVDPEQARLIPFTQRFYRRETMEQYTVTGHELRGLLCPGGKGRKSCARRDQLLGEPADQLHGSGGHRQRISHRQGSAGGGLRRKPKAAAAETPSAELDALADHETPRLEETAHRITGLSGGADVFSMGHMMWGWPLPHWFDGNHVAMGLVQLLLAGIVMVINQKFFISGFKGLLHRAPNMDTLVALGSSASFLWSTYALFAMTRAQVDGNDALVMHYMMELYFESAAMILTLITVGKMLEARSKGKTTDALKSLMKLAPRPPPCCGREPK